jgi:hypothetical protein
MAPQTDEFGTKVGLLAGLVVICAARPVLDRLVPPPQSDADDLRRFVVGAAGTRPAARLAAAGAAALLVAVAIVAAGFPARGVVLADPVEALNRPAPVVDPTTLPPITISQDVVDFDHELAGSGMQAVVVTLAQNLELENRALLTRDASLLPAIDHGDRLVEMQDRLARATASGTTALAHYQIDALDVSLLVPFGRQDGLSLGLNARGTVVEERYDAAGSVQSRASSPFRLTFAMRQATGDRWLIVAVLPPGEPAG